MIGDYASDAAANFYYNCPVSVLVLYGEDSEDSESDSRVTRSISPEDEEDNNQVGLKEMNIV